MKKHKMIMGNIYDNSKKKENKEFSQILFSGHGNFAAEKIISSGETTPEGEWLSDERRELVVLLSGMGKLRFACGEEVLLSKGDYLVILPNTPHKVVFTSSKPEAIWLCVYGS